MEDQEIITIGPFIEFVKALKGQELTSRAGRAKFTVEVTNYGLCFTPVSTDKLRQHHTPYVKRVLEQFNRTHSFLTSEYKFTINATYQLALISLYLKHKGQAG